MTAVNQKNIFEANPLGKSTTIDDIKDSFEFLDDWEDRYGYIIDLGKKAPSISEDYRINENYIHGCQSQVWFIHYYDQDEGRLYVLVDSDAMIVKGLAAVVMSAFNYQSPADIAQFNMENLFEELELLRHLSPTRGNGLRAMVQKIQETASRCA